MTTASEGHKSTFDNWITFWVNKQDFTIILSQVPVNCYLIVHWYIFKCRSWSYTSSTVTVPEGWQRHSRRGEGGTVLSFEEWVNAPCIQPNGKSNTDMSPLLCIAQNGSEHKEGGTTRAHSDALKNWTLFFLLWESQLPRASWWPDLLGMNMVHRENGKLHSWSGQVSPVPRSSFLDLKTWYLRQKCLSSTSQFSWIQFFPSQHAPKLPLVNKVQFLLQKAVILSS